MDCNVALDDFSFKKYNAENDVNDNHQFILRITATVFNALMSIFRRGPLTGVSNADGIFLTNISLYLGNNTR